MDNELLNRLRRALPDLYITNEIKRGGQKVVYSAKYRNISHSVFKVVIPSCVEEKKRAIREINIASSLTSPLFPRLYDFGEYSYGNKSVVYVVEELILGQNLRDLINSNLPNLVNINEVRRIVASLLNALEIINSLKLVHRDIKPENIIVSDRRVVLIDFGIARHLDMISLTETYAIFGPMTPGYSPPEQINNQKRKISIRTDLFALGVVFYELLTGENPFCIGTNTPSEVVYKTMSFSPPKLSTKGFNKTFDDFVSKCIEKNCHRRPASISQAWKYFKKIKWEV